MLLTSALLLCSSFVAGSSVKNDHTALAIPNNKPPVVKVGHNQTVNENTIVTLDGIAYDPDPNDKLSYSWKQISGRPPIILNNSNTTNPSFIAPRVSAETALKFSMTAKDNKGGTSNPANITITVKHINRIPLANAGQAQIVNEGYVVTLDGSKSQDPDGNPLTYSWKQVGGPNVTLNGANTPIARFTAPKDIPSDTAIIFELTVRDDKNAANISSVKVTDKYIPPPNQPPVANAGIDQTVNAGDIVNLDGSGSKDPDGNIASYSWTQTAGPAVKLNNSNTVKASFTVPNVSCAILKLTDWYISSPSQPPAANTGIFKNVMSASTATSPPNPCNTTLEFSLIVKDNKGAISTPATVSVFSESKPPLSNPSQSTPNPTNANTNLPRNVSLTYEAKYIPPESRPPAQKTLTHSITAKVAALPETLANIMKVVYLPQPASTFSSANYTADSAVDNFAVSWVVWGGFDLTAKVYFKDGQVIDLPLKRISLTTEGDTMQMFRLHSGTS